MYVVDASVWVGLLVATDYHHASSRLWVDHLAEQGETTIAPVTALVEFAGAVSRVTGDWRQATEGVDLLRRLPHCQFEPIDSILADLAIETAARLRLKGADALYTALAQSLGATLVTWDDEQRRRSLTLVDSMTPQEALSKNLG